MTPFIRSTLSDEKEEKGLERSEFYCDDREREREKERERERERDDREIWIKQRCSGYSP